MLSKSFALFVAFAAFIPAFAAPVPDVLGVTAAVKDVANDLKANVLTRSDPATFEEVVKMLELSRRTESSGCSVAEVDAIISNVLNNGSISILSSSKRSDCDLVGVTAEVKNVLNNLHISVLSSSKRSEGYCSLADVEAVVYNVANDMKINVLSQSKKRSGCDVVKVTAIVKDILENLDVNVLTQSKRSTYSVSAIATKAKDILEGKVSKRGDTLANVVVAVEDNLDHLTTTVAKRDDVDVVAEVKNVLNKAKIEVA
ncbi:hypothetical protein CY34DRAFT_9415 [Suillus luteus UH-Slu-Lm8-n1]|uniref:Uncharacterized protein n=1 Tax=Suillus luteus UH-Slu-Lm8-n1 TaxID=930992 RepID=A0A0D0A9E6_9AGAM|nr:hypothetical protein CY34DRAFT_9415 [Suillus luteus UH-Slu-Lm8-n1]